MDSCGVSALSIGTGEKNNPQRRLCSWTHVASSIALRALSLQSFFSLLFCWIGEDVPITWWLRIHWSDLSCGVLSLDGLYLGSLHSFRLYRWRVDVRLRRRLFRGWWLLTGGTWRAERKEISRNLWLKQQRRSVIPVSGGVWLGVISAAVIEESSSDMTVTTGWSETGTDSFNAASVCGTVGLWATLSLVDWSSVDSTIGSSA